MTDVHHTSMAEEGRKLRLLGPRLGSLVLVIGCTWSLFQLWIASPLPFMFGFGLIGGVPARAIHLAFGFALVFLMFSALKRWNNKFSPVDALFAVVGCGCALYLFVGYQGLVSRAGIPLRYQFELFGFTADFLPEIVIGGVGILLLLEATRRSVGIPLAIVCTCFLLYSLFGQLMPELIAHKGVSLERLIGYQWLGSEAIFGIPLRVSTEFVFLFVLFGAMMDKAGGGRFFLEMALALVGKFRGGPAKAAILASGLTGMVSGSSIANVVTTGAFTIPVMRKVGFPAVKAGAFEVSASTNGQLMPPIMGAAAFMIAEFIGISYLEVIVAAAIPALLSYMALFYISHLEALKLGLKALSSQEIPQLWPTLRQGVHFLLPIGVLLYLLIFERLTASTAVLYAILATMGIMLGQALVGSWRQAIGTALPSGLGSAGAVSERSPTWLARVAYLGLLPAVTVRALRSGVHKIYAGLAAGACSMAHIAIAIAAAGIIVGAVAATGLNNALLGIIEAATGGNFYLLLLATALLAIVLGMGLPTTANYIVVASLLANVLVELGDASGLIVPLIAVHLFVFYFGLLADSTPPVCLAAFAASAISKASPMKTGVQAFLYDIRTAILPFIFIFSPSLLLVGVESLWHGMAVFIVAAMAMLCFSAALQGWLLRKLRWYEIVGLLMVALAMFRPDFITGRLSAPHLPVDVEQEFIYGGVSLAPQDALRVHVTRQTDYGDRLKLFAFEAPAPGQPADQYYYGLLLEPTQDGRYEVIDLAFNGRAEEAGITWGDYVTAIDRTNQDRWPAWVVYPFALGLLGLIFYTQWRPGWLARLARQLTRLLTKTTASVIGSLSAKWSKVVRLAQRCLQR